MRLQHSPERAELLIKLPEKARQFVIKEPEELEKLIKLVEKRLE